MLNRVGASRSSIGSNPASPASSANHAVSVIWFMAWSPWRLQPPVGWVSVHPEITPPSNFHQLRYTTLASTTSSPEHGSPRPGQFRWFMLWARNVPAVT